MALSFVNSLEDYYFSSQVPDIVVQQDAGAPVTITLYRCAVLGNEFTNGTIFYTSTYYPLNNRLTVYDLREIIEAEILKNALSVIYLRLKLNSGDEELSKEMTVLYCHSNRTDSAADFLQLHFLTTAQSRVTTKSANEYLPYFYRAERAIVGRPAFSIFYTIVYLHQGTLMTKQSFSITLVQLGVGNLIVSYQFIKEKFAAFLSADDKILSYTVRFGNRTCTFYLTQRETQRMFYFRNCFNALELAILPVSTANKLETKSSSAVCGDVSTQYDIEHTRSYEMETSALLLTQADWLTQFLTSRDIRYWDGLSSDVEQMPQILITDYDYEISDEPGTVNAVKFEWQFANCRDTLRAIQSSSNGIFSEQFSSQFA